MTGLLAGVLAFMMGYLTDVAVLRGWRRLRLPLYAGMTLLFCVATYDVLFLTSRFAPASPVWIMGLILLLPASLLFIYSEFVEIPLAAYLLRGSVPRLVDTGTYALCRHPGVLWAAALFAGLILVSRSTKLLVAAPIWLALDVLWVWMQDKFFFPRLIPGYKEYQNQTPMLWPNRRSLKESVRTSLVRFRPGPISRSKGG